MREESLTLHGVGEDAGDAQGSLPRAGLLQVVHGRLAEARAPPLELRVRGGGPLKPEETEFRETERPRDTFWSDANRVSSAHCVSRARTFFLQFELVDLAKKNDPA